MKQPVEKGRKLRPGEGIVETKGSCARMDKDEISSWAAGAVGALYSMDAIHGYEGYFDPQDPISRCQAVTLLNNLIGAVMTHLPAEGSLRRSWQG